MVQRSKWSSFPVQAERPDFAGRGDGPAPATAPRWFAVRLVDNGSLGFTCELNAGTLAPGEGQGEPPMDPARAERVQETLRRREHSRRIWVVRARTPGEAVWNAADKSRADRPEVR